MKVQNPKISDLLRYCRRIENRLTFKSEKLQRDILIINNHFSSTLIDLSQPLFWVLSRNIWQRFVSVSSRIYSWRFKKIQDKRGPQRWDYNLEQSSAKKQTKNRSWKNKDNNEIFRRDATKINVKGKGATFLFLLFRWFVCNNQQQQHLWLLLRSKDKALSWYGWLFKSYSSCVLCSYQQHLS